MTKIRRLATAVLAVVCLTACPQASQFLGGPGSFDANKTSSPSSAGDKGEDKTILDERTTEDSGGGTRVPFDTTVRERNIASGDAPPSLEPPPVIAPPQGTGDTSGGPPPPPGAEGSVDKQSMYAYGAANTGLGPMFPKPDGQDTQRGRPRPELRYGENFSQSLKGAEIVINFDGNGPIDLKLLMVEPVEKTEGGYSLSWVPETDGARIRAVYRPTGRDCDSYQLLKYADAKVTMTPDGSNVNFTDLHARSGAIVFTLYNSNYLPPLPWYLPAAFPLDYNDGDFAAFQSREDCLAATPGEETNVGTWVGVLTLKANGPAMLMTPRVLYDLAP
ncbi:MAG TPA: hypothetical protein VFX30_07505 [bacterium]|nr:hypothetical protein [bacterium]